MSEFIMPSLGADMESGILVEWMVKPGERIHRGDTVAAVETVKGIIDIDIYQDGVIDELRVQPGEKVPVGTVLATLIGEGEETAVQQEQKAPGEKALPEKPELAPIPPPAEPTRRHGPRISPAAHRRAAALHVDMESIIGTGPDGAITVQDVEQVSAETGPAAMRGAIAAAMSRSKREIPHYYLGTTIDLSRTLAWLERQNAERPITERMVYAVPLIKAVALALGKVPDLNGFWVKDHFEASESIHIGVAISLRQGGLVAPALHDVQSRDLDALMQEFHDLVNRTRSGHIRLSEFTKPTITFTSLGEQGVETTYPIIYPPQVAIVGFGSIIERPWSIEGQIESRRVIKATLAADHRVSDGRSGAVFLNTVNKLLQKPEAL